LICNSPKREHEVFPFLLFDFDRSDEESATFTTQMRREIIGETPVGDFAKYLFKKN